MSPIYSVKYVSRMDHKRILLAWDKNKDFFDFNFHDTSADVSVDSSDPAVIKRVISAKIKQSDIFLCLIGEKTKDSSWIKWEIEKACEFNKNIVAVKIDRSFESPDEILNVNAEWAMDFTFDSIKKAIELCSNFIISKGGEQETKFVKPPSPWSV